MWALIRSGALYTPTADYMDAMYDTLTEDLPSAAKPLFLSDPAVDEVKRRAQRAKWVARSVQRQHNFEAACMRYNLSAEGRALHSGDYDDLMSSDDELEAAADNRAGGAGAGAGQPAPSIV